MFAKEGEREEENRKGVAGRVWGLSSTYGVNEFLDSGAGVGERPVQVLDARESELEVENTLDHSGPVV